MVKNCCYGIVDRAVDNRYTYHKSRSVLQEFMSAYYDDRHPEFRNNIADRLVRIDKVQERGRRPENVECGRQYKLTVQSLPCLFVI